MTATGGRTVHDHATESYDAGMVEYLIPSVFLILIALPVAVLRIADLSERRVRSRRQAAAERFRCECCGETLGSASLQRADEIWAEKVAALRRDNPDIRFRLKRWVFAVCMACGAEYDYDETHTTFHLLADDYLPHPQGGAIDSPVLFPNERSHPKT